MKQLVLRPSFTRDIKGFKKKHYKFDRLKEIVDELLADEPLKGKHRDRALVGTLAGYRELHIEQNVLLIYRIEGDVLFLIRFGTHDDLFA